MKFRIRFKYDFYGNDYLIQEKVYLLWIFPIWKTIASRSDIDRAKRLLNRIIEGEKINESNSHI